MTMRFKACARQKANDNALCCHVVHHFFVTFTMAWPGKLRDSPSGWTQIWKFWRHCCCRYGWWPLLVAFVCTAALLLDLYSSFSCEFLQVNVGFSPSNNSWNQSTVNIGIFLYEAESSGNEFGDNVVEGCVRYSEEFQQQFIDGDKTWTATQIMAMIATISGLIAAIVAWLLVLTPAPACFIWPGVMLPAVMLAFLAEASKFLFFDVSICHASLWYPSGAESMPQTARSCSMGRTGAFIISSSVVFFIGLVMICLKAPELRILKEDYGESYHNNFVNGGAQEVHSGSLTDDPESQIPVGNLGTLPDAEDEDSGSLRAANTSMVMSMSQEDSTLGAEDPPSGSFVEYPGSESFLAEVGEDFSTFPLQRMVSDESEDDFNSSSEFGLKTAGGMRQGRVDQPSDAELHALAAKVAGEQDEQLNSLAAKEAPQNMSNLVEQSDDLIDKCVTELQESFKQ